MATPPVTLNPEQVERVATKLADLAWIHVHNLDIVSEARHILWAPHAEIDRASVNQVRARINELRKKED